MTDHYTTDEKQVIHKDGWTFYVRDSEEGMVEIGYREWSDTDKRYVPKGKPMDVPLSVLGSLTDAMKFFVEREAASESTLTNN